MTGHTVSQDTPYRSHCPQVTCQVALSPGIAQIIPGHPSNVTGHVVPVHPSEVQVIGHTLPGRLPQVSLLKVQWVSKCPETGCPTALRSLAQTWLWAKQQRSDVHHSCRPASVHLWPWPWPLLWGVCGQATLQVTGCSNGVLNGDVLKTVMANLSVYTARHQVVSEDPGEQASGQ